MTELEWVEEFRNNLAYFMNEAGYSKADLAEEIGVSKSTVSRYLSEDALKCLVPKATTIVNIAYALDCDIGDLIDFDERIED